MNELPWSKKYKEAKALWVPIDVLGSSGGEGGGGCFN